MCDERAEARLALPPVEVLGERGAFDRERDLRGERLERVDELARGRRSVVATTAARASRREPRAAEQSRCSPSSRSSSASPDRRGRSATGRAASGCRLRSSQLLGSRGDGPALSVAARGGELCAVVGDENETHGALAAEQRLRRMDGGAAHAVAPARATSSTPACRSASSRAACRSSWRTSPAMRATTSRNRIAEATMTTRTSGLPNSSAKRMPGAIRHAMREQAQPQRRQTRADVRRRLLEGAHRRVQRGCAPQDVVGDPADVEAELMVVGVRRAARRCTRSRRRAARRCWRRAGRRPARACRRRPRAGSPRRGAGCLRADRRSRRPWRAARARRDGCSARRGSPRRGARTRRSGSARRSRPHDPVGFRRRTSSSSPPTRAG